MSNMFDSVGSQSAAFKATAGGVFVAAVIMLLAAFNVMTLTDDQKEAIFNFGGATILLAPMVFGLYRTYIKKQEINAQASLEVAKVQSNTVLEATAMKVDATGTAGLNS